MRSDLNEEAYEGPLGPPSHENRRIGIFEDTRHMSWRYQKDGQTYVFLRALGSKYSLLDEQVSSKDSVSERILKQDPNRSRDSYVDWKIRLSSMTDGSKQCRHHCWDHSLVGTVWPYPLSDIGTPDHMGMSLRHSPPKLKYILGFKSGE